MSFSWKICGLLLLACIHLTLQSENDITDDEEQLDECEDFGRRAEVLLQQCGVNVTEDGKQTYDNETTQDYALIDILRCVWDFIKEDKFFKTLVDECVELHPPKKNETFLCGFELLICSVDLLDKKCPSMDDSDAF